MGKLEKLTLFSLILLLVWGNMVSGLGAGLACPDWPLCFGKFFPELNFAIFMEHTHRVLGLIVSIFFFFLAKKRFKSYHGKQKLVPILCGIFLISMIIILISTYCKNNRRQRRGQAGCWTKRRNPCSYI